MGGGCGGGGGGGRGVGGGWVGAVYYRCSGSWGSGGMPDTTRGKTTKHADNDTASSKPRTHPDVSEV